MISLKPGTLRLVLANHKVNVNGNLASVRTSGCGYVHYFVAYSSPVFFSLWKPRLKLLLNLLSCRLESAYRPSYVWVTPALSHQYCPEMFPFSSLLTPLPKGSYDSYCKRAWFAFDMSQQLIQDQETASNRPDKKGRKVSYLLWLNQKPRHYTWKIKKVDYTDLKTSSHRY